MVRPWLSGWLLLHASWRRYCRYTELVFDEIALRCSCVWDSPWLKSSAACESCHVHLTHNCPCFKQADASASEASTLPSLSPPEAESPFAETVSEKGTMSADVLSWIQESSSQVPRGCEPWVEKRQKVRSKTPPEQDNDSINAADTVGEGGRGDTQAERRQLRGLRRNLSEPLS